MAISPYFQQGSQGVNPAMTQLQGYQYPQQQQQQQPSFWQNLGKGLQDYFIGTPGGLQPYSNFEPHQIQALNQLLGGGLNQIQNPYEGFQPIENYAREQFSQQTVPSLAERFTSLGAQTGGRTSSPAFASQLGSAGAGLESMLAAQRAQYGQQQQQTGLQTAALGLTPQFSHIQTPGSRGLLGELAPVAAQAGLMAATGGLSGAPAIASLIGSLFKSKSNQ